MGKTNGIDLKEMIIVVLVVILVIIVIVAALSSSLDLARRDKCGHNLSVIGNGIVVYSGGRRKDLTFPWADNIKAAEPHLRGPDRIKDPRGDWENRADAYPVSTSLYILIHHYDVDPAAFVCPGSDDQVDAVCRDENGNEYWDFRSNNNLSYSFQAPVQMPTHEENSFLNAHSKTVALADRNPIGSPDIGGNGQPLDKDGETQAAWSDMSDLTEPHDGTMAAMSPNHGGRWVNAMRYDCFVRGSYRADIGFRNDCIWTPSGTKLGDSDAPYTGHRPDLAKGIGYDISNHLKHGDTFLIDTPDNK